MDLLADLADWLDARRPSAFLAYHGDDRRHLVGRAERVADDELAARIDR